MLFALQNQFNWRKLFANNKQVPVYVSQAPACCFIKLSYEHPANWEAVFGLFVFCVFLVLWRRVAEIVAFYQCEQGVEEQRSANQAEYPGGGKELPLPLAGLEQIIGQVDQVSTAQRPQNKLHLVVFHG